MKIGDKILNTNRICKSINCKFLLKRMLICPGSRQDLLYASGVAMVCQDSNLLYLKSIFVN